MTLSSSLAVNMVYGLVASFCFLGFLLMGLVACGDQLSIAFLKQRLHRALVTDPGREKMNRYRQLVSLIRPCLSCLQTYLLLKESGTCAA